MSNPASSRWASMFVVAADLAANPRQRGRLTDGVSRVTASMVEDVERIIDRLVAERPLRPVFVVPGTSRTEAALDLARSPGAPSGTSSPPERPAGR